MNNWKDKLVVRDKDGNKIVPIITEPKEMISLAKQIDAPVIKPEYIISDQKQIMGVIRQYRLDKKTKQETMASRIGITRVNYTQVERGTTKVTLEKLLKICDELGLDIKLVEH